MFKRPWICSRCLSRQLRPLARRQARFQSTDATASNGDTIYPALISRARAIAAEHKTLSKQLETDYTVSAAKKAGELSSVVDALQKWDKANEALSELRKLLRDPSTDPELQALASEDLESTASELTAVSHSLTTSLVPRDPFADLPCVLEVRPGAGGSEAGIFANDLFEMYKSYCSENGLRCTIMEEKRDEGMGEGIMEAILSIDSPGAYGILRCEAGVHRVQRVPKTESAGRIHTSAAAVMVLPSASEDGGNMEEMDINNPASDFYVDPTEVRLDVMRSSGAGGQHVNKTESAVRLTHLPTNTVVSIQTGRSQLANRKTAWNLLRSRLAQSRREAREEEVLKLRRSVVGVAKLGRGDKIRTYNWAQQRITDHRSGVSVHGIDGVMAGGQNLEKVMESVRRWMVEREVEGMVAEAEEKESAKDTQDKSKKK